VYGCISLSIKYFRGIMGEGIKRRQSSQGIYEPSVNTPIIRAPRAESRDAKFARTSTEPSAAPGANPRSRHLARLSLESSKAIEYAAQFHLSRACERAAHKDAQGSKIVARRSVAEGDEESARGWKGAEERRSETGSEAAQSD
jgi:hypothetical protein